MIQCESTDTAAAAYVDHIHQISVLRQGILPAPEIEREHPDRQIAVVIPQLVEKHWYEYFLHKQRSELMAASLLLKADQRISIVNVPWHLHT
ncbi:MAG TPA: hypothetical protein VH350_02540 [Candidatus Sulfotelmatobacter sp.]|nr:hypothetical protein [Candidatus Sulfotelmatobacter sp.]